MQQRGLERSALDARTLPWPRQVSARGPEPAIRAGCEHSPILSMESSRRCGGCRHRGLSTDVLRPRRLSSSSDQTKLLRLSISMATLLRRPFAITSGAKQLSNPSATLLRAFHNTSKTAFRTSPASETFSLAKARQPIFQNAFHNATQQGSRRTITQQAFGSQANNGDVRQKLIYGGAFFGGTLLAINLYVALFCYFCCSVFADFINTVSSTVKPVKMAACLPSSANISMEHSCTPVLVLVSSLLPLALYTPAAGPFV